MKTGKRPAGYILRERKALPVYDVLKWARWFETADRRVALTEFLNPDSFKQRDIARMRDHERLRKSMGLGFGLVHDIDLAAAKIVVSTTFLGLDHNWRRSGPPLLFETMIFNGPLHDHQQRYATWEEAEAGHRQACDAVARALVGAARILSNDLPATHGR
jgi:hypothetical protein